MSAAELREAAETLREMSTSLSDVGEWYEDAGEVWVMHDSDGHSASGLIDGFPIWADGAAKFIATMHPGVGLALADVLDLLASHGEAGLAIDLPALALARLINGGAA